MIITYSVSEYIERKEKRLNTTSKIEDGELKYFVEGLWVTKEYFDELLPPMDYRPFNEKGINPCKNRNYINEIKSY